MPDSRAHIVTDELLVGVPHAGRNDERFERTVGLFMNFLVLRADPAGSPTFLHLLQQIKKDAIEQRKVAEVSTMPTGLLDTYNVDEILDLLAFIQSASVASGKAKSK